jgi:hypothetical protein
MRACDHRILPQQRIIHCIDQRRPPDHQSTRPRVCVRWKPREQRTHASIRYKYACDLPSAVPTRRPSYRHLGDHRRHDNRARRTLDELPGIFIHIAPLQPTPYILLGILMYVRGATRPTLWPLMGSSIIIIHLHPFSNINNNIINLYLSSVCIAQPSTACVSHYPHTCVYMYIRSYVDVCICCLYTAGHRTRRGRVTSLHVPHSVVYMRRQTSAGATAWPAAWSKHSSKLDAKHPRERPSEQVPQSAYRLTPTVCVYEPSLCAVYVCE